VRGHSGAEGGGGKKRKTKHTLRKARPRSARITMSHRGVRAGEKRELSRFGKACHIMSRRVMVREEGGGDKKKSIIGNEGEVMWGEVTERDDDDVGNIAD